MCGRSWSVWAGVRNGPRDGHGSATKSRSGTGRRRCGPRLKKSAPRRAHSRLHRRKRTEPTAASLPHLGAARANPGFAIQLQLEESVAGRRADSVELLLSPVSRCREEGASAGLSASRGWTPASAAAGGVGPFAGAPQSTGSGLPRQSARLDSPRIPPSLRAGTEPVEFIWAHWKQHELPNLCPKDYYQLSEAARRTLRRMRRRPRLITAFWQQASLWPE